MRADDAGSDLLQLCFGAIAQRHLANVVADVEAGVELPVRQAEVERRERDALAIVYRG